LAPILLWLAACCATAAQDAAVILAEPGDIAVDELTYGALVAMALPGTVIKDGHVVLERDLTLPHIEGADFTIAASAPLAVHSIEAVTLTMEGRAHLALVIEMAETEDGLGPVAALALFDVSQEPILIDVKDVGFDRMSGFAQPPSVTVGAGHALILISNSHGNAGQYYDAITIIDLVRGALTMVDMVMTLSDTGCAGSRTQYVHFDAIAPAEAGRGDFRVGVTDQIRPPADTCDGVDTYAPSDTTYGVDYRWNAEAERYEAQGDGWFALNDLNSERY